MTTNQVIRCPVCGRYKKHGAWIEIEKNVEQLMIAQNMHIIEVQCIDCIQGKYRPTNLWNLDKRLSKLEESFFFNYKIIYSLFVLFGLVSMIYTILRFLRYIN